MLDSPCLSPSVDEALPGDLAEVGGLYELERHEDLAALRVQTEACEVAHGGLNAEGILGVFLGVCDSSVSCQLRGQGTPWCLLLKSSNIDSSFDSPFAAEGPAAGGGAPALKYLVVGGMVSIACSGTV